MASEKTITLAIQRWLKKQADVFCWKQLGTSMSIRGLPDICGNVGTAALYLEVKTETGKLSASQVAVHARIRKSGAEVYVVRSVDDAREAVRLLREHSAVS